MNQSRSIYLSVNVQTAALVPGRAGAGIRHGARGAAADRAGRLAADIDAARIEFERFSDPQGRECALQGGLVQDGVHGMSQLRIEPVVGAAVSLQRVADQRGICRSSNRGLPRSRTPAEVPRRRPATREPADDPGAAARRRSKALGRSSSFGSGRLQAALKTPVARMADRILLRQSPSAPAGRQRARGPAIGRERSDP